MSPRQQARTPHRIGGDRADLAGWPRLVEEFCEWMGVRGYSERTIGNRRAMLSYLVDWLAERGITRPVEVTRPVLEAYQRYLFHYRMANGNRCRSAPNPSGCSRSGRSSNGPPGPATCCTTPPARSSCRRPSTGCRRPR